MSLNPDDALRKAFNNFDIVDSKQYYTPIVLPKSFNEMDDYIKTNKKELLQTIVEAIEAAFEHDLSYVEVFKFERSGFVVVISESEFKENLLQALSVLKKDTDYCTRISKMLDMIKKGRKSNVKKAKKPKADKKPTKRRKSTKRKPKKRGGLDSGSEDN